MRTDLQRLLVALVLACLSGQASAESFDPVDLADDVVQARTFEAEESAAVLRAALSVLQDLKFFVTDVTAEPGLITADTTGCRCSSGSVTVTATMVGPDTVRVRVVLTQAARDGRGAAAAADFYQSFFTHLGRARFRQEQTP